MQGRGGFKGSVVRGLRVLPIFCNHLVLQSLLTVLFEVERVIINASLTKIYPNTIETCLTVCYLAGSYFVLVTQHRL